MRSSHATAEAIANSFVAHQTAVEQDIGGPVTIDGIAGPYKIFQRAVGQRHSIDDAATAWYALRACPRAERALDLGTGIGSVGLAVLWGLPPHGTLTCIEAQEISFRLLQHNITHNQLSHRITAHHGDLRTLALGEKFPLVTGSPPYFPAHAGVLPADTQKAYARFELRGHVGDYAATAATHLTPEGRFVFCFPSRQRQRCWRLVTEAGLSILTHMDVVPHAQAEPLFTLYSAALAPEHPPIAEPPLIVAGADGKYTEQMLELQRFRGFGNLGEN